jgi:CRISPR-associated protein Csd2
MTGNLVNSEATKEIYNNPKLRHDWIFQLEVTDGILNGDPDASNLQRTDPETNQGIATDVSTKRQIRNFVEEFGSEYESPERYNIYVKEWNILNDIHKSAFEDLGLKADAGKKKSDRESARLWICNKYYDVRMFGGVLSTGDAGKYNAGQVRGPMQVGFARTYDPVFPQLVTITRICVTNPKDEEKERTMGNKSIIHYGLFRMYGFYNPYFGEQTGVTEQDLSLFWEALEKSWEINRSNSKGLISPRNLIVFSHENPKGNAHAHKLFERLSVRKIDQDIVPRSYADYIVELDEEDLPAGITVSQLI